MKPGVGSRSAALARAQAHLSRKRVPGRGLLEGPARQTPTSGDLISSSSSSDLHLILSATQFIPDLIHLSESSLAHQGRGDLGRASLEEIAPSAWPQSRFLKQKTQTVTATERDPTRKTGNAISFKENPSAILKRVAQIESQFQSQKTRVETKQATALEDELSWTESSQKVEQMPESFSYLKMARPKDNTKSQTKTKLLPGDKAPTETSLLDKSSLSLPRSNTPSPELSRPVSRSIIRSLNELFSEASDTQSEASTSSDFRVNILSLDELVPAVPSKEEELKEEEEATTVESSQEPHPKPGSEVLAPPVAQSTFSMWHSSKENEEGPEEEESDNLGEIEISEQFSHTSAELSSYHDEGNPSDADYSEDFEPSPSASMEIETEAESPISSARHSSLYDLSSHVNWKPPRSVQDAAVQTSCSFSKDQDSQSNILPIGLSPGGRMIETSPTASRFLSLDVLEAMSAYSPAALALNEMLKQNALLIQQFVEANHQLHTALVASLEEERFHYHTLEEVKQYINRQKPSLNMEQTSN